MQHNKEFKHTGKCFVCGYDTKLPIHIQCGKKMDEERKKTRKIAKNNERYINYLGNLDN